MHESELDAKPLLMCDVADAASNANTDTRVSRIAQHTAYSRTEKREAQFYDGKGTSQ